jgi:hypothetical protein
MSIRRPARKRSAWSDHDWGTIIPVTIIVSLMSMLVVFTTHVAPRARLRYCHREYHAARTAADTAAVDRIMVGARLETCGTVRTRATPEAGEPRERGFPAARAGEPDPIHSHLPPRYTRARFAARPTAFVVAAVPRHHSPFRSGPPCAYSRLHSPSSAL